jgi:hypothetical protein
MVVVAVVVAVVVEEEGKKMSIEDLRFDYTRSWQLSQCSGN